MEKLLKSISTSVRFRILNTVWPNPISSIVASSAQSRRNKDTPSTSQSGRLKRLPGEPSDGAAGITVRTGVRIPRLSDVQIDNLQSEKFSRITRHFSNKAGDLLERTLAGSFKFGTVTAYRAAEKAIDGRFGDHREGLQREVFRSRSGIYDTEIAGFRSQNVEISGFENPFVVEFEVNEFCSCSSGGDFSLKRAQTIRGRGNPDIDTYVVYDYQKLVAAIVGCLQEREDLNGLKLITREVTYGAKDLHWEIEGSLDRQAERDHAAIWLGTIFVKPNHYAHEEEVRMTLVDPARVGLRPSDQSPLYLNDSRIAAAILSHGTF